MERLSHKRTSNDKNKRTTTKNANNSQIGKKKYNKETDKKLQRNEIISDSLVSFPTNTIEGLTLETSAFLPFTLTNLRFQLSC